MILSLLLLSARQASATEPAKVLVLQSYHQGLSWTDNSMAGIMEVLDAQEGLDIQVSYMDAKRYPPEKVAPGLLAILKAKYSDNPPDVVIACDNSAFSFLKQYRKEIFPNAPIVFTGINGFKESMLDHDGQWAGVLEQSDAAATLKLIRTIHPDIARLVVISDRTDTGWAEERMARTAYNGLQAGLRIEYWNDVSVQELRRKLQDLTPGEDIVLLTVFNRDRNGTFLSFEESAELISDSSPVPVYGLWDFYLGHGVVGGHVASSFNQGKGAGRIALRILNGESANSIGVSEGNFNRSIIDYSALERFGVSISTIPSHVLIINSPYNWFQENKGVLLAGGALMIIEAMAILFLIAKLTRIRHQNLREAQRTRNMLYTVINNIPHGVYWKDQRLVYLGCNRRYAQSVGLKDPAEIIGRKDDELPLLQSVLKERREEDLRVLNGEESILHYVKQVSVGTDPPAWLDITRLPVRNSKGTVLGILGLEEDITEKKEHDERLRKGREQYELAIRGTRDGIWDWDLTTNTLFLSARWKEMLGYEEHELKNEYQTFEDHLHPADKARVLDHIMRYLSGELENYSNEFRCRNRKGQYLWVLARGEALRDENGIPYRMAGSHTDITEKKKQEQQLQDYARQMELATVHANELTVQAEITKLELETERANLQAIFDAATVGMVLVDEDLRVARVNESAARLAGRKLESMLGTSVGEALGCIHSVADGKSVCGHTGNCQTCPFQSAMQNVLQGGSASLETEGSRHLVIDNSIEEVYFTAKAVVIDSGGKKQTLLSFSDITKRKKDEQALDYQARHDALTGLANRRFFTETLADLTSRKTKRSKDHLALLFIDLDRFKHINDTLGHKVGDLLLVEVSKRLNHCLRDYDFLARVGGDEFTAILGAISDTGEVDKVADRMLESLMMPFDIQKHRFTIGASIGIALFPDDAVDADTLVKNADSAMYAAKEAGRNRVHWFTRRGSNDTSRRQDTERELRNALDNGELAVFYQPIVNLASRRIERAEALLRWNHPERGMVSPGLFIPVAEETGLIHPIGDYVLTEACRSARRWNELGFTDMDVAVNLSSSQFQSADLLDRISDIIVGSGMDVSRLLFEMTESTLAESEEREADVLFHLRDMGIRISIDDFGIGFSSLARLKRFPFIHLKVDGSFVREITTSREDQALTKLIVDMAHTIEVTVTAEWVENEDQLEIIRAIGCDFAQGYLISPPLPADNFEDYLVAGNGFARQLAA